MTTAIRLPKWLTNTRTMQFNSIDLTLSVALVLRIHGTADAVRRTAFNLRHKVCMEHQPMVKRLAKLDSDRAVLQAAKNIVQRVTDQLDIYPGRPFEVLDLTSRPRCHYQPMHVAGDPGARVWACRHCDATQPIKVII